MTPSIRFEADDWRVTGRVHPLGAIAVPGDKSIAHRAILLASLSSGRCTLRGMSCAEDVRRTADAMRQLGVHINAGRDAWFVDGVGPAGLRAPGGSIDCGNSGTTMRLLCGILVSQPFASRLTGDGSLLQRPMRRVVEPLRRMGARIECTGSHARPPVDIQPPVPAGLHGCVHTLGVDSAQVRSAIVFAALRASSVTRIRPAGVARDHTERLLRALGVGVARDADSITVQPAGANGWDAFGFRIPADASAAAFFVAWCVAARRGEVRCRHLGLNPGRVRYLEILRRAGAHVVMEPEDDALGEPYGELRVSGKLERPIRLAGDDVVRCIDEVPALLAAAAGAGVPAQVRDAGELRVKESDRIATMARVLRAFGASVHESRDGMRLEACAALRPADVDAAGDHRVAMAAAVMAARVPGESRIRGVACVGTSYPTFAQDFNILARV